MKLHLWEISDLQSSCRNSIKLILCQHFLDTCTQIASVIDMKLHLWKYENAQRDKYEITLVEIQSRPF